jgi:hypothetical protein
LKLALTAVKQGVNFFFSDPGFGSVAIGPINILVSFTYIEVEQLVLHLDLPKDFVSPQTRVKEAFTALCMLLCHLEYPAQLCDVKMQLSWEATHFSQITQLIAQYIYDRWKHVLRLDPTYLTLYTLQKFSHCMSANGSPHDYVTSLMDGTLEEISNLFITDGNRCTA